MRTTTSYIAVITASAEALVGDPLVNDNNKNQRTSNTTDARSERALWSQVGLLTGYSPMFLLCVVLIVYLRFNRNGALKGDANAARKVILPAFEPLLWILATTTGVYTAFFITTLSTNYYTEYPNKRDIEMFYSGRQFVFVIVVVFMLQSSVSGPALRRTVLISLLLSTYTIPIVWTLTAHYDPSSPVMFWSQTLSRGALQFFFIYVYVRPPGRAKRTPLRQFCVFVVAYYVLSMTSVLFKYLKLPVYSAGIGYLTLVWAAFCPLLIWRVLKADTEFWRGLGERACSLQHMGRQQTRIDERVSSRGLHLLIEMHRKFVIDFAHLELKKRIGVGANSVVFNGVLESKTLVAAKVYTPLMFTEDTIASFSHEAALCATLCHPNIVKFYGMCICPPTVCLVSELCLGNLEDVMVAVAARDQPSQRQQSLINLGYMIDAARALAYIHSFTPPFLHRDVKPSNFLVDDDCNVKLTDFGESRSIPRERLTEMTVPPRRDGANSVQPVLKMTITGTVDYMAPEMIRGRAGIASYGEAADVYSLAITFWDILNPGCDRYPRERSNPMLIFETVVDGTRPDLDIPMHSRLRELIANSWQTDPSLRPTTRHIVAQLEGIQEELLAMFAAELSDEFERSGLPHRSPGPCHEKYFTGEYAIERMEDYKYITTPAEGIRLGNALMDAGFLHHLSHEQCFEDSDAMYFFDEDNVKLCQPFAILEADVTDSSESSVSSENELRSAESFTASSRRRLSIGVGPKGILSQLTASLTSSGRSLSKTSIFSSNSDTSSGSVGASGNGCQCRRLAQRLDPQSHRVRRRHHRSHPPRRKCTPILEEDNPLELKLLDELDDEEGSMTPSSSRGNRSSISSNIGDSQQRHVSVTIAA